ncbi:MAG: O-antigen ligase family protein [Nitrospiria bacterium]
MNQHLNRAWRDRVILSLVFLFPILIATLRDAASTIYYILVVLSFFYYKNAWCKLRRREKHFLIGLGLFFTLSLLSLLMTEDLYEGIKRLERFIRLVLLTPIYLMLRKERIETGKAFMLGTGAAVFVMLGQALYQVRILNQPIAHGAYHKIIMGNTAILYATLLFIAALYFGRKKSEYALAALVFGAGCYTSLLSGTRTSWLFVPVIVTCLLWIYRKELSPKAWRRIAFGIVLVIILFGITQPKRLTQGFAQGVNDLKTFQQDPTKETSWGARLVMWHNSFLIFKGSPLVGTGIGDFRNDSKKLFDQGLSYKNDFALRQSHVHNLYLQLLAEGGLVGLILLVAAFFVLPFMFLYDLWQNTSDKRQRFYALSGLIAVFAFAWFGVSESWALRNPMITSYCVTMLVFLTSAANRLCLKD